MATNVTLGIDIGGTNTKIGLVDKQGNCLEFSDIPTLAQQPVDYFLARLFDAIDTMLQKTEGELVLKAIGIGAPNANYYNGCIEKAANLNWGDKVPLVQLVKDKYKLPVTLTNDANAAALGEMQYGVAKGMRDFVVITLGTGLGSGIVTNGELVYGHDGFAGELGHLSVNVEGRECGCGKRGCLETYVSATGIKRTVYKLLADMNTPTELRGISFENLTAKMITEAALRGDRVANEAFEYTGRILGLKLADTVAVLSPEAIIIFGGLANAGELLMGPTRVAMEANLMRIFKGKTKLMLSNLKGDNTAILGSSALAWHELGK